MPVRTLSRCLALFALLLLVAPVAPAESSAVQPGLVPQTAPPAMRLQAVDAERPRAPNIDMREALAYLRQNPGATYTNQQALQRIEAARRGGTTTQQATRGEPNAAAEPAATTTAPELVAGSQALLAQSGSGATDTNITQEAGRSFNQGSPTVGLYPGANPTPQQGGSFDCAQVLQDSGNSDPLHQPPYWPVYERKVYYTPDLFTSAPNSWLLIERGSPIYNFVDNDDTVLQTNGTDLDGFGQSFTVPADANSIALRFNVAFAPGTISSNDRLYYEFYFAQGNTYGSYITGGYINSGVFADGTWRTVTDVLDDAQVLQQMRGQQVVLRLSTRNNNEGLFALSYLDDITTTPCGPTVIGGRVTQQQVAPQAGSTDLSDVALGLIRYEANGDFTVLSATRPSYDPAIGFYYGFVGLPPLEGDGAQYQVVYFNLELDADTPDDTRLGFWFGPKVGQLGYGQVVALPSLDVTNLALEGPDSYSEVVLREDAPVTFSWLPRGVAADRYRVYMYDPELVNANGSPILFATGILDAGTSGLIVKPSSFPADFNFRYGRTYHWFVAVYQPPYDSGEQEQYGWSYYERAVSFLQQPESVPNNPPPVDDTPPVGRTNADWTVMIYIAGDNDLGNLSENPNPDSNLQGQFASLKAMASRFPRVNIVTLTDFYGNTGTQFCFLNPLGAPDCQELGEQNTADPATLTTFVNNALERYPAPHTMLVVADHGHAITGVAEDTTTPNRPQLGPDKLRQAFEISGLRGRKLDILFYNTCLMGAFEVAFDAQPYANYMVASADMVWVLNFYDKLLPLLASSDPKAVAAAIPAAYRERVKELVPDGYASMAAYDLSFVPAVNSALSALGQQLKNNDAAAKTLLATIRLQVQVYDSSGNYLLDQIDSSNGPVAQEEDALVDLVHLATLLRTDATFGAAAQGVLTALGPLGTGMILSREAVDGSNGFNGQKQFANSSGLAIYFPNGNSFGEQLTLTDNYLNKGLYAEYSNATLWDDFVKGYAQGYNVAQGPGRISQGPGRISQGGRPVAGQVLQGMKVYIPIVAK